ncbi:DUF2634 domain-containing protein [Sporosarcina cyprini]|uniref:DUF2634 domain-containing protein n=1 Tax=Sporosarcina cyprini TaxID=2910523 RepID=UPI001EDDD954|nr:DUF2634 domain-containing protein [Sporosarcina cyprini]MCG3089125.1 DUF2634 domain-containing protein [Sporosarcina cyprini]
MNLPEITQLELREVEFEEELEPIGKTYLYDFDKGDFVMRDGKLIELYGVDSIKQWILKVLKTESFRFRIYEDETYGTSIESLIGSNLPRAYIESEIEREVTESLLESPYIERLEGWQFERDGKWMRIRFTVISPMYNTIDMEVSR